MKKISFVILFFISAGNCFGQQVTFQKTYGGISSEEGNYVQQTTDGGYIIVGQTQSFGVGTINVYLLKTDSAGELLWTKTYGGTMVDEGYYVQQTTDGGYIIVGYTYSFADSSTSDIYLIKTDANGDSLWTKTYGGLGFDEGFCVQQTTDGGYVITGFTHCIGAGDIYLIKTDSVGNLLWSKLIGGPAGEEGRFVLQTPDGGYIILGTTSNFGAGSNDVYLIKTDTNGNPLWSKTYGGSGSDFGWAIQQTTDGGYIITGSTFSFTPSNSEAFVIKTGSIGNLLWTKTYGGVNYDWLYSVQQTADGGYMITGITSSFNSNLYDVYLIRTDANGDTLWTKTIGGANNDWGMCIQQTMDGGYIIAGTTQSFGGGSTNVFLIKTDSNGNSGCNELGTASNVTIPAIQSTSASPMVTSCGIVTTPATIIGSGGIVTTLCSTVGIQFALSNPKSEISISPNPTTNNFTIAFPNTINKGVIEIYNVMGEKIFSEDVFNVSQKEIHLKNMNAGIYFLELNTDGEKMVRKILKQ